MSLSCQKHLFMLEPGAHYLNGAAYSPTLRHSVEAGQAALLVKAERPFSIAPQHHFDTAGRLRHLFSKMVHAGDPERIALIPAVSYGMAVVAQNLPRWPGIERKKHILLIGEEFPNNVYAFERVAAQLGLSIKTVAKPDTPDGRGEAWNAALLQAIDADTALVAAPQVHWIYGTVFDLAALGRRCREAGALLAVDATQSIGIMPFDVQAVQPDALITAGYQWVLGPYGTSMAYFGAFFDEGIPLEEGWMNRQESEQFARLTRYERAYRPKAQRYNAGEYSQFVQLPMLEAALEQLLDWEVAGMQTYCQRLTAPFLDTWQSLGYRLEAPAQRAAHLFGLSLPAVVDAGRLFEQLAARRVYASLRGGALRVSVNVYNDAADVEALTAVLTEILA
ncbi:MAG: aminotransferase class V-fold PLP-dependent enzyme [Saprospiraceae bacterium]|nr:aminotransferase class V-fold PLP-dependent enzyme [Saprospiraceae bacterium]